MAVMRDAGPARGSSSENARRVGDFLWLVGLILIIGAGIMLFLAPRKDDQWYHGRHAKKQFESGVAYDPVDDGPSPSGTTDKTSEAVGSDAAADSPAAVEGLTPPPASTEQDSGGAGDAGDAAMAELLAAATPAPDEVSEGDFHGDPRLDPALDPPMNRFFPDNCDPELMRSLVYFDEEKGRQVWKPDAEWCGIKLPISGADLRKRLAGKKVVFLGDSVVRNSFVLTMAKMCNEENMDKCMIRTPTYEYDFAQQPNMSGPMGCIPGPVVPDMKSPCYRDGEFADVTVRGLSTSKTPKGRGARKTFIQKGMIGAAMNMKLGDTHLIYVPVTKPRQITKTGGYLMRHGKATGYLHADYTIVSIGPHFKALEVEYSPLLLNASVRHLRAGRGPRAPIVFAEFVHAVGVTEEWDHKVNEIMARLRKLFSLYDVALVPQRQLTRRAYVIRHRTVPEAEAQPPPAGKECGYYDNQHPAMRCQSFGTELLLAAAFGLGDVAAAAAKKEDADA